MFIIPGQKAEGPGWFSTVFW